MVSVVTAVEMLFWRFSDANKHTGIFCMVTVEKINNF